MKARAFHVIMLVAGFFLAIHNTPVNSAEERSAPATEPFPSEAAVEEAVPIGMLKAELIKRYGKPLVSVPRENGSELLVYQVPGLQFDVPANFRYSGFSVMLTNERVAYVNSSHYSVTTNRWLECQGNPSVEANTPAGQTNTTKGAVSIRFHEISEEAFPGGRYVDTKFLPKTGYIREQPDMEAKVIKEVKRGQQVFGTRSNDYREILSVTLTDADAKRFARLTDKLVGQRLLITVGTEPISAPVVQIPIKTGRFALMLQTADEAGRIFEQLRDLVLK